MALQWKWEDKIGELEYEFTDEDTNEWKKGDNVSLYEGNALLIALQEDETESKLYTFWGDELHAKNMLGLNKRQRFTKNEYETDSYKVTKIRLNKNCRNFDKIISLLIKGFKNLTIEFYTEEQNEPVLAELPEQCYSVLPGSGEIIIVKRNEKGYYTPNIPAASKEEAREIVDEYNGKLGVTRAQEEAMRTGSMFGFHVPGADPKNYDKDGKPLPPLDRGDDQ